MNSLVSSRLLSALRRLKALPALDCAWDQLHMHVSGHVEVARAYAEALALADAEAHLEAALALSQSGPGVDGRVDLLCELSSMAAQSADAAEQRQAGSGLAARRRARGHAAHAAQLAARVSDPVWEIKVLLRISDVFGRLGNHGEATDLQMRALRLMALEMCLPRAGQ